MRLLAQLVNGDVRLWTHVDTTTALAVQVVEAFEALLATSAIWLQFALTRLQEHTLRNDGCAHGFVATKTRSKHHCKYAEDRQYKK